MKRLILLLLMASTVSASESIRIKFFSSSELQHLGFFHDENGFHIIQNDEIIDIPMYWVDPSLRKASEKQLKAFLEKGYITITKTDHNEFNIRANVRGLGGGPVTAMILGGSTKAVCYGGMLVAAGTVVGATGVGAVAVAAAGEGLAVGASAASAAITTLGGTAVAAEATTLVAMTGNVVAAVETASGAAFWFGMWLPLP